MYNYDLDVVSLDPLTLSYQPATKGAYVTVIGNENLKDGSEIEVVVVSANGFYTKRYKITIRYNKAESAGTRYLRNLAILLGIILAIILVISRSNKFHKNSLIKKIDDTNNQNPTDGLSNNQHNNGNYFSI